MASRILWFGFLAAAGLAVCCQESPPRRRDRVAAPPHVRLSETSLTAITDRHRVSRGGADPQALEDAGVRLLTQGLSRQALLDLEGAALQTPVQAGALSDLAAAHLTLARQEGQQFHWLLALDASERALALRPDLKEALFNRAEALTSLQLTHQATAAWEDYRRSDPGSHWTAEAERHIAELAEPTSAELWTNQKSVLATALAQNDRATVRRIVGRFADPARVYAESELLPAWAAATPLPGRLDPLAAVRQIAAALHDRGGDDMLLDTVAAIARAQAAGDRLRELRRGHQLFAQAMQRYEARDFKAVRQLLVPAGEALRAGGSPFAAWTELYIGICDYYGRPKAAWARLLALVQDAATSNYPALRGRASWMLGTIAAARNHPEESLNWTRSAVAQAGRASGPDASGLPLVQLAAAFQNLGQPDRAWEARLAGLAALRRSGNRRYRVAALGETVVDLLQQDQPRAALAFSSEAVVAAEAWGDPEGLAEARLRRGWALLRLGRSQEALEEVRSGRGFAADIPLAEDKRRELAGFDVLEASLLADHAPVEAIRLIGDALAARRATGYLYRDPVLLAARAESYGKLGDVSRQEEDLRAAIEEHERIRAGVRDKSLRLSSFQEIQPVFDEMVRLQWEHHGDAQAALSFAERARSRLLLDLVAAPAGATDESPPALAQAWPADRIVADLPVGVTLVEYLELPDRLLAWVLRRGSVDLMTTKVRSEDLDRAIDFLRGAITRRAGARTIQRASAVLQRWLIRPLEAQLPAGEPVVFVPDRALGRVPFALLFDAERRRYLLEDHPIALAPSATLYLVALERKATLVPAAAEAFVVGDPAFDPQRQPGLERLAEANQEALDVGALYSQPEVLRGEAATRSAFLAGAPSHRIVHFAGHALLHPTESQLSRLIFAPEGNDPGVLYARDLAGYRLDGTELVVLSACRTLDGAAASRESLVGLAAAFLAAGPPVVVSSLWRVEDRPTRQLMVAFHQALRRGADPAAALRQAQLELLTAPGGAFTSPADWAGFEAIGGVFGREN